MLRLIVVCILIATALATVQLQTYLNTNDVSSLRVVFEASKSSKDLSSIFYGSAGLKLLGEQLITPSKVCDTVKSLMNDDQTLEVVYYLSGLSAILGNDCKISLPKAQQLVDKIDTKASAQELYYAAYIVKHLKLKQDSAKFTELLTAAMKKDDSASSLSYIFNAASQLDNFIVDKFMARIEDCIAQADEIDNKYLQFEGGLSTTAIAVAGIFEMAQRGKKSPSIKPDDVLKLTNYLLSRKGVTLARPAYHLVKSLTILADNKFFNPVVFTHISSTAISSKNPNFQISVTDVLGKQITNLDVAIESAVHTLTKKSLYEKKQLKLDTTKKFYEMNFMEAKPAFGFYKVTVGSTSLDKRLIGLTGFEAAIKVTCQFTIEEIQIGVLDRDQTLSASNVKKLQSFSKLSSLLEADTHQKLAMKFLVKDKATNSIIKAHQVFALFTHTTSKREIIFIAEPIASNAYVLEVDFQKTAKDFDYQSGKYTLRLIIGDAVADSPINWIVADVNLKLPVHEKVVESTVEHISFDKKPTITHIFKPADKRPGQFTSDLFAALCLLPILILFVLWIRLGINFSNFHFDVYTIGFHLGLVSIFGLYFVFWLRLNMFQTLKYLAIIGCFTFLTGNRMLKAKSSDGQKVKHE